MSKRHRIKLRESKTLFYREIQFRAEDIADDGTVKVIASTDAAVDFGGYREVLTHADGAVDFSSCRSALLNHDKNQIIGGVRGITISGGQCLAQMQISPDARTQTGVKVLDLVRSGALSGVSIGYTYSDKNASYDEDTRTVTARKWMLREISLTPTQADTSAHVERSLPESFKPAARPAAETKESRVSDDKKPAPQGKADDVNHAENEAVRAAVIKASNEAKKEAAEVASLARSHDLEPEKYLEMSRADASVAMLRDIAEKRKTIVKTVVTPSVESGVDQADKARDAFAGAMAFNAGIRSGDLGELQKNNPLVGRGIKHAVRKYARLMGIDTEDWSDKDVAYFAVGKPEMMDQRFARSANVTSSTFPNFVFLNALTKIVAKGYEQGSAVARYKQIVSNQTVPDFKQFSVGALASANFAQTAEDTAFPELSKAEGVYNSTVKMWGGTLSLTVQAIVGDDTAQFDRLMGQAGSIADKTIDRRVFQKLLMGTSTSEGTSTWTSNTTSGGSLVYTTADLAAAARGKLSIIRAALMNKVGLDGNPLGTIPRYLICGPTRETEARGITGDSGPLLTAGVAQPSVSLAVIATPWLEASALTGNSTTSYYLLADPNDVTGLVLTKIRGYESVQVQPYDAGAVAAMNFKLWLPFEADLHFVTVGASTKTIAAAQQGTT